MKRTPIIDKQVHYERLGDLKLSDHIYRLVEAERYLIDSCQKRRVFWSYDVTANEPYEFQTINYTTYAGCLLIMPLQPELADNQMVEASRNDSTDLVDFVSHLRNRVEDDIANKYDIDNESVDKEFDAIVVLPGDNKIKTNICRRKLEWILEKHGDRVIFKPHPITREKTVRELKELIGAKDSDFAPIHSDLYELIQKADTVYTSHISESCLYSVSLGKEVNPIDQFHRRHMTSFGSINRLLFIDEDPIHLINPTFSSHKSGIICPDIEDNWKEKIDNYLDYILAKREHVKNHFIQGD